MRRLIALDRAVHCAVLAVLGAGALAVAGRPELGAGALAVAGRPELGVVLLAYAVAEGVEAAGLWRRRRWAEHMTFAVTASLLPFEIALVWERPTPLRIGALVVNAAVAAYLGRSVVRGRQMQ